MAASDVTPDRCEASTFARVLALMLWRRADLAALAVAIVFAAIGLPSMFDAPLRPPDHALSSRPRLSSTSSRREDGLGQKKEHGDVVKWTTRGRPGDAERGLRSWSGFRGLGVGALVADSFPAGGLYDLT
jgi:hypothetical protein